MTAPGALPPGADAAGGPIPFIGAFESTYMPAHDIDIAESSGHIDRWQADLDALLATGVKSLRYPVRWHRVEHERGRYRWADTARALDYLESRGVEVIVDLLHHTSYPAWLRGGFGDPRFGDAFVAFCQAFGRRFPGTRSYTVINEPFATLFLCGHEGIWPPYGRGMRSFVGILRNVLPAVVRASRWLRAELPAARHVYVDTCEGHTATVEETRAYVELANDRRFFVLDALLGRVNASSPFARAVASVGGEELFDLAPIEVDVLGLDYYAHSEWSYADATGEAPSRRPLGLRGLIDTYAARYSLPLILSETNIRGATSDRATWLRYTLEQCEAARADGVPIEGYCWFPFVDSVDWNTLLREYGGCIDPVGVLELDENLERRPSSMSEAYALAAGGCRARDLPAYRFTPALEEWLGPLLPGMAHFDWREPPREEVDRFADGLLRRITRRDIA